MTRPHARPTVLLVDDCREQRDIYEIVLARDFRVVTAGRGLDALALATSERPDVVVLDVMMPGIDGWETCTRLKVDPATLLSVKPERTMLGGRWVYEA